MKNKKLVIIAAAALAVILAVLLFLWPGFLLKKPAEDNAAPEVQTAGNDAAPAGAPASAATPEPQPVVSGDFEYIPTGSGTAKITRFVGEQDGTVEIPEELNGLKVTALAETAFERYYEKTYEIVIPNTLTQLDGNPFTGCERVRRITLAGDHPTLTFKDGLLINKADKRIIAGLWDNQLSAPSVTIPDDVKVIGEAAFANASSIEYVTIPDSVTEIGYGAFSDCRNLKYLSFGSGVTSFGKDVLSGCSSLKTIVVSPENRVLEVKNGALYSTNDHRLIFITADQYDETFEISEGTEIIETYAFRNYKSLKILVIPDSVTTVGTAPFTQCYNLKEIRVSEDHPVLTVSGGALINKAEHRLICYPRGRESGKYTVPEGVTVIADDAFYNCKNLTGIVMPDGMKEIGERAFYDCSELKTAELADSITKIGKEAFDGCVKLYSINLPAGQLKEIAADAFRSCLKLSELKIPEGVQVIGQNAFRNCYNLKSVTMPASVMSIAADAFDKDSSQYFTSATLTFRVPAGSYAETWCVENGKSYKVIDIIE